MRVISPLTSFPKKSLAYQFSPLWRTKSIVSSKRAHQGVVSEFMEQKLTRPQILLIENCLWITKLIVLHLDPDTILSIVYSGVISVKFSLFQFLVDPSILRQFWWICWLIKIAHTSQIWRSGRQGSWRSSGRIIRRSGGGGKPDNDVGQYHVVWLSCPENKIECGEASTSLKDGSWVPVVGYRWDGPSFVV